METNIIRYTFCPGWKLTLFYLLLLPLLVGLGFWQLYRADYKQELQTLYDQRSAALPVLLSQLKKDNDVAYRRVRLQGRFDDQYHFLLDNRTFNGRPGYEVISAFWLEPALVVPNVGLVELIWVNRGWLPMGAQRSELPEIPSFFAAALSLSGQLVLPTKAFVLADIPLSGLWPEVIQAIDLPQMKSRLRGELAPAVAPYLLRLDAAEVGSFEVRWQPVNTAPQKSLGYAVQWFLMAFVLTGLYFWAGIRKK